MAHLATVELNYATEFGDDLTVLEAFENLFLFDKIVGDNDKLLDSDLLLWAKESVLALRLRLGQFDMAQNEYSELQRENPEIALKYAKHMEAVADILIAGKPYKQKIKLGDRSYKEVYLAATKFELQATSGEFEKLTFRCERGFSEVVYQADSQYAVPSKWGECWVQISGSQNASAILLQYK